MKLLKLEILIKKILESNVSTREDDMRLYYEYCNFVYLDTFKTGIGDYAFKLLFKDSDFRKETKIYNYASVERVRRKIQANHPELCSDKVKTARINKQKDYINYSINYGYKDTLKNLIDKEDYNE